MNFLQFFEIFTIFIFKKKKCEWMSFRMVTDALKKRQPTPVGHKIRFFGWKNPKRSNKWKNKWKKNLKKWDLAGVGIALSPGIFSKKSKKSEKIKNNWKKMKKDFKKWDLAGVALALSPGIFSKKSKKTEKEQKNGKKIKKWNLAAKNLSLAGHLFKKTKTN